MRKRIKKGDEKHFERRATTRKLTQTRVIIHHDAFGPTPLKTSNLSQGGVFVTTTAPVSLLQGTTFDITFMIDLGNVTKLRKVAATVVQSTPMGLRLRFS